jgi:hypothetical protein
MRVAQLGLGIGSFPVDANTFFIMSTNARGPLHSGIKDGPSSLFPTNRQVLRGNRHSGCQKRTRICHRTAVSVVSASS